jgi:6-phosphogluconolactonase
VASAGATTPLVLRHVATSWTQPWLPIVLLSDERHSSVADERNDEAVRRVLRNTPFDAVSIVAPPIDANLTDAARTWAQAISSLPQPIVALVSMADDGHVAGLFADCRYESVSDSVVVTRESPKAPSQRISLSAEFLRAIPHRIAIVTGLQKSHVLARLHKESVVPIASVCPSEWFTDSPVPE